MKWRSGKIIKADNSIYFSACFQWKVVTDLLQLFPWEEKDIQFPCIRHLIQQPIGDKTESKKLKKKGERRNERMRKEVTILSFQLPFSFHSQYVSICIWIKSCFLDRKLNISFIFLLFFVIPDFHFSIHMISRQNLGRKNNAFLVF